MEDPQEDREDRRGPVVPREEVPQEAVLDTFLVGAAVAERRAAVERPWAGATMSALALVAAARRVVVQLVGRRGRTVRYPRSSASSGLRTVGRGSAV